VDQRSFWTAGTAEASGNLCRPPVTFSEPARMLAFAPFQGFIWRMSDKWHHVAYAPLVVLMNLVGECSGIDKQPRR
jgi:hypothetical protein